MFNYIMLIGACNGFYFRPSNSVWWKPLPDSSAAVVLYASRSNATIGFRFSELTWQGKPALASADHCQIKSIWDNACVTSHASQLPPTDPPCHSHHRPLLLQMALIPLSLLSC